MANWRAKNPFLLTIVRNKESLTKDNGVETIKGEKERYQNKRRKFQGQAKWVLLIEIRLIKETNSAKNQK